MAERPIADVVRRAIAGDRAAQDAVWREHRRFVAAVLLCHAPPGLDVEDALQDVALALVRRIGTLADPAKIRPWLRSIAIRATASAARRPGVETERLEDAAARDARGADDRDEAAVVLRLVEELPVELREPLVLRALRGLSQREIADALGLAETTIETRLVRARRAVRDALARRGRPTATIRETKT